MEKNQVGKKQQYYKLVYTLAIENDNRKRKIFQTFNLSLIDI